MEEFTIRERKDRRKGRNYSIAIHVILLLLLFIFWRFPADPAEAINNQYAVAIDFTFDEASNSTLGQEAAGARAEQANEDEQASQQEDQPLPKVEEIDDVVEDIPLDQPVEESFEDVPVAVPEVVDVVEDESPIEATQDIPIVNEEVADPKPAESKPTTSNNKKKTTAGSGTGSKNTSTTSSNTSGSGKADSGSGSGSDPSGNDGSSGVGTGGNGTGAYDGSGRGIFGRKVIERPLSELGRIMGEQGKIVFKSCINPYGAVSYIEIDYGETTIRDKSILKEALRVARMYRYERDLRAPDEQCGKLTILIDR